MTNVRDGGAVPDSAGRIVTAPDTTAPETSGPAAITPPDTTETASALGGQANLPDVEHDPSTRPDDLATTEPTEQPPPAGGDGPPPALGAG